MRDHNEDEAMFVEAITAAFRHGWQAYLSGQSEYGSPLSVQGVYRHAWESGWNASRSRARGRCESDYDVARKVTAACDVEALSQPTASQGGTNEDE